MEKEGSPILPILGAAVAGLYLAPEYPLLGGALLFGVAAFGIKYYREHSKLAGVFRNVGLTNKDGQVPQLREKKRIDGGRMYRYSLPPGFCVADVEKHQDAIEGYLGKTVSITTRVKDAIIEVYDQDIEPYEYAPSDQLEIGRGRGSRMVVADLDKYPHIFLCGITGSGKSSLFRCILCNFILLGYKGCRVHLWLVDLKGGTELQLFKNHAERFARTQKEAELVINLFAEEIDRRYEEFFQAGVISKKLEKHVLVIDEFAEITDKNIIKTIESIAARGRACGCHLLAATQRPSADIVTGTIKANMSMIGLRVLNELNSRIIIDKSGLERISEDTPGRGIFRQGGEYIEFQAPWLSEDRAKELLFGNRKPTFNWRFT